MTTTLKPISGGLRLSVDTPTDGEGVRDDIRGIRVWCSISGTGFTVNSGNLVYDGPSLQIDIKNLQGGTASLSPTTVHYVRYAYVNIVDSADSILTISELSATPNRSTGTLAQRPTNSQVGDTYAATDNSVLYTCTTAPDTWTAGATVGANASNFTGSVGGDNLLMNSDFSIRTSELPAGFSRYNNGGSGATSIASTGYLSGSAFGIKAGATPGTTLGFVTSIGTASQGVTGGVEGGWKANTTYSVSFYAKKVAGAGLTSMDLAWNISPTTETAVTNPTLTTSYQRYVFRISWGASVETNGGLYITASGTKAANDEVHIDLVKVELGDVASSWSSSYRDIISASQIKAGTIVAGNAITIGTPSGAGGGIVIDASSTSGQDSISVKVTNANKAVFGYLPSISVGGGTTTAGYGFLVYDGTSPIFDSRNSVGILGNITYDNYNVGDSTTNPYWNTNTKGINNLAIGPYAMNNASATSNRTDNIAIGVQAGRYISTAKYNIYLGNSAGIGDPSRSISGLYNIGIGFNALMTGGSGADNIALGSYALAGTATMAMTGNTNIAIGSTALAANIDGSNNIAIGKASMSSNATGESNIAIGVSALSAGLGNSNIISIGGSSLLNCTGSYDSIGIGTGVAYSATYIDRSILIGSLAASVAPMVTAVVAIGDRAAANAIDNIVDSVVVGNYACGGAITAAGSFLQTVAIGHSALSQLSSGIGNTALGYMSGNYLTGGSANTFLGGSAGAWVTTGSYNTFVGVGSGTSSPSSISNAVILGSNDGVTLLSGDVWVGNGDILGTPKRALYRNNASSYIDLGDVGDRVQINKGTGLYNYITSSSYPLRIHNTGIGAAGGRYGIAIYTENDDLGATTSNANSNIFTNYVILKANDSTASTNTNGHFYNTTTVSTGRTLGSYINVYSANYRNARGSTNSPLDCDDGGTQTVLTGIYSASGSSSGKYGTGVAPLIGTNYIYRGEILASTGKTTTAYGTYLDISTASSGSVWYGNTTITSTSITDVTRGSPRASTWSKSTTTSVTVTYTAHGLTAGGIIWVGITSSATYVPKTYYVIESVTDANNFVITGLTTTASSGTLSYGLVASVSDTTLRRLDTPTWSKSTTTTVTITCTTDHGLTTGDFVYVITSDDVTKLPKKHYVVTVTSTTTFTVVGLTTTADSGTCTVCDLQDLRSLSVDCYINSTNLPPGSNITAVNAVTRTLTMGLAATATSTAQTLYYFGVSGSVYGHSINMDDHPKTTGMYIYAGGANIYGTTGLNNTCDTILGGALYETGIKTITASLDLTATDTTTKLPNAKLYRHIVCNSASALTITLPIAASYLGINYTITNINSGTITISRSSTDVFSALGNNAATSYVLRGGNTAKVKSLISGVWYVEDDSRAEGTWTPAFSSSGSTFSYASQVGYYHRIGNQVTVTGRVQLNTTGNTFTNNVLIITGLPFTSSNVTNRSYRCMAGWQGLNIIISSMLLKLGPNSSSLSVYTVDGAGNTLSDIALNPTNFNQLLSPTIDFTLTYFIG